MYLCRYIVVCIINLYACIHIYEYDVMCLRVFKYTCTWYKTLQTRVYTVIRIYIFSHVTNIFLVFRHSFRIYIHVSPIYIYICTDSS